MFKQTIRAALLAVLLISSANAAQILLDRGLPNINLNAAAGANRSNVAWAFEDFTTDDYFVAGDSFANTSEKTWVVDSIRLWTVGRTDSVVLRDLNGGSILGSSISTTYPDPASSLYGASGLALFQIDFVVNFLLAPGQSYSFFVDGSGSAAAGQGTSVPFAHASNAALSGTPQDGADDLILYARILGGLLDPLSVGSLDTHGNGWDKSSDLNVQVFGTAIPEPATLSLTLLGLGFLGLLLLRRLR